MRVLIVDDEPLARDVVRFFLEDEPQVQVIGDCEDAETALASIEREAPDLVFLDVQMPGTSGVELLRALVDRPPPAVVFVSAFDQHAVDAFELHAVDYVLKPVEESRFRRAVARAREQLALRDLRRQAESLSGLLASLGGEDTSPDRPSPQPFESLGSVSSPSADDDRLLVRGPKRLSVVRLEELDWVEAAGDYVYLHCGAERHLLRQTLSGLEKRLDSRRFRRIHRGTLVNLERIAEIRFADHGDLRLRLRDGTLLRVSRTYRASLGDFLDA